ncbi:hypothetical protein EJ02DRAFT_344259 [Clathrospora elynae]|uniref:Uncharacterized protein n=1 Tax=Clathrospora elynae TaxID=706981 RepID=A0A6A5SSD7_9PLEO|nr:hypothetical protein EJ02DRAFT_344259 [Clathrospora elynae]
MCYYEKIHFPCTHTEHRLIQHCHFARNDPGHQCFGAWNIKREWQQRETDCDNCIRTKAYGTATRNVRTVYSVASGR